MKKSEGGKNDNCNFHKAFIWVRDQLHGILQKFDVKIIIKSIHCFLRKNFGTINTVQSLTSASLLLIKVYELYMEIAFELFINTEKKKISIIYNETMFGWAYYEQKIKYFFLGK